MCPSSSTRCRTADQIHRDDRECALCMHAGRHVPLDARKDEGRDEGACSETSVTCILWHDIILQETSAHSASVVI